MRQLVTILGFLFCFSAQASNQDILVHNGFATGQKYLEMNVAQKKAYAMGAMDGMLLAPLMGAPKKDMAWLETCAENMTDVQVAAILTKYLENNPGQWHESAHVSMFSAMMDACHYKAP